MSNTSTSDLYKRNQVENNQQPDKQLFCPSAQADWKSVKVFGVAIGTVEKPKVSYLEHAVPLSQDLIDMVSPVDPAEVFRVTSPCASEKCLHYKKERCQLVKRTVANLQAVTENLPKCPIRESCRWWDEHHEQACYRCPQVVTNNFTTDDTIISTATPSKKNHKDN